VLVEDELTRQSATAFEPVSEITTYLLGGAASAFAPRFFCYLPARWTSGPKRDQAGRGRRTPDSATLIHDDVIDSADRAARSSFY